MLRGDMLCYGCGGIEFYLIWVSIWQLPRVRTIFLFCGICEVSRLEVRAGNKVGMGGKVMNGMILFVSLCRYAMLCCAIRWWYVKTEDEAPLSPPPEK